ncbi:MAG: hydantoinase/oxoprolinase family protein [Alphaproteobacteria bacterium]|nr:hydantoinase/oxoprolinase family protein [Alphaproteobacteria bacterium]
MAYRISVDTGGTFTDVVVADEAGIRALGKAPTTPDRIFLGMRAAIENAAGELKLDLKQLFAQSTTLIYGTTRAVNAIIQGKTAKTAFLTTEGFPDVLVMREGGKTNPHDFTQSYPPPYIPRRHTFEITERVSSEGDVSVPLDRAQAIQVLDQLKTRNFEAIAVCLIWSVANAAHELALGKLIDERLPGVPYTLSHKLIPIVREYRRASATAIDASLKPLMQRHLREMEADLRAAGFGGEILVSTSIGGCMHVEDLVERPIHTVKSGPAMAPVAGRTYARVESLGRDSIVCDTGGTTFDVGLVRDGELVFTRESWLGPRWTGHIMSMSTVDVRSIGAGGGSIAWIDSGGLLRVGPHSAGAVPGPACYGAGGTAPTVTDAALVLGYLDPAFFLGGRMKLDVDAAKRAVNLIASPLKMPLERAAYAIITLASEHMIKAIREITINEGVNPRESALVAGGGAAGLNIVPIAKELGCTRVLVPRTAGALSACGMQFSDIVTEHSASRVTLTSNFDFDGVNDALQSIEAELDRFVDGLKGRAGGEVTKEFFVEARYLYQVWELEVPLPMTRFKGKADIDALRKAFNAVHERVFAVVDERNPVECLNWKGRVAVRLPGVAHGEAVSAGAPFAPKPHAARMTYFDEGGAVKAPIFIGGDLRPGALIKGPAVIEEPTTTIVVYPGSAAHVTGLGNFILDVG